VRVSLQWLGDFVDLPPTEELCSRLAQTGIEVEHVSDPAVGLHGVVVAEVTQVAAHPSADKLRLCQVFDGTETFTVVCGAPNVTAGLRVALARVGARLPELTIKPRTIRGVASTGMLCGKDELGWHDQKEPGIWELPSDAVVGADIATVMGAAATLTLGITPNRPDLLSHLGVSREIAAATGKRHKSGKWRAAEKGPDIGSLARVVVEDNGSCKRYMARVVRNLKIGPSPAWLVERLHSVGQRSVNNVVDATNYVMHELGLPLHAFDLARLGAESGAPTVRVRRATEGEQLITLDGVTRKLTTEDLVIADAHRAIGLAGVMGGANSEVTRATVNVLLEAAYFEPMRIRQMAKRHGLRTEASLRF
jgi:phenylalanyl-tRNA synthetase beta chain